MSAFSGFCRGVALVDVLIGAIEVTFNRYEPASIFILAGIVFAVLSLDKD